MRNCTQIAVRLGSRLMCFTEQTTIANNIFEVTEYVWNHNKFLCETKTRFAQGLLDELIELRSRTLIYHYLSDGYIYINMSMFQNMHGIHIQEIVGTVICIDRFGIHFESVIFRLQIQYHIDPARVNMHLTMDYFLDKYTLKFFKNPNNIKRQKSIL